MFWKQSGQTRVDHIVLGAAILLIVILFLAKAC